MFYHITSICLLFWKTTGVKTKVRSDQPALCKPSLGQGEWILTSFCIHMYFSAPVSLTICSPYQAKWEYSWKPLRLRSEFSKVAAISSEVVVAEASPLSRVFSKGITFCFVIFLSPAVQWTQYWLLVTVLHVPVRRSICLTVCQYFKVDSSRKSADTRGHL